MSKPGAARNGLSKKQPRLGSAVAASPAPGCITSCRPRAPLLLRRLATNHPCPAVAAAQATAMGAEGLAMCDSRMHRRHHRTPIAPMANPRTAIRWFTWSSKGRAECTHHRDADMSKTTAAVVFSGHCAASAASCHAGVRHQAVRASRSETHHSRNNLVPSVVKKKT